MNARFSQSLAAILLAGSAIPVLAAPDPNPDPTASVVYVRTNCNIANSDVGESPVENCFESMQALTTWMAGTRRPNGNAPLRVEIGPGFFGRLVMNCNAANGYTGYVSFVGSGRLQTYLYHTGNIPGDDAVIESNGCTFLSFSDLYVYSGYAYIVWNGGGSSNWNNVEVDVGPAGWVERTCGASRGRHDWFGSRFVNTAISNIGTAYTASCDNSWFYGSEITQTTGTRGTSLSSGNGDYTAIVAKDGAQVHVYGSVVRAISNGPYGGGTGSLTAVFAASNSQVHLHGTGIDVITSGPRNVLALAATGNGEIHANGSAYNLKATSGTITRVANNGGHIHAPYLWEHIPDVPIVSVTGADMATVTTSNGQPRLVIYSTACPPASSWYDAVDDVCRP